LRLHIAEQERTSRALEESKEHFRHVAFHDSLTELPNRALFIVRLRLAIDRTKQSEDYFYAVLFMDLDRFKNINDSLGHTYGDQLLIAIARRLETCLREEDTLARFGGDEFAVLLNGISHPGEATLVAERIQHELMIPFDLSRQEAFTTASIGIALSIASYEQPEDILRDADTAMYQAKDGGKARHVVFDELMHASAIHRLQLETDLRRAVERDEFFILYQPIVELDNFNLRGFEALVRWRHPEQGIISPIDFIPIAEETGLIIDIGSRVLREACRQMHEWQEEFPTDPTLFISVNLSGKQLAQDSLINEVESILKETGVHPHSLKLEITETVVMENTRATVDMLKQLRGLGVQLSIDDFGTGYCSLSYLHRFPIDTLKIDRSFVSRMTENDENTAIVRTIILLAHTLKLDVVAEGVETSEELALLRKLACENGQGYYFSRPIDAEAAKELIADNQAHTMPALFSHTSFETSLIEEEMLLSMAFSTNVAPN
jgi:diguanylate cyclase (GGDEF)-like protein